jgi:hypothetical protein
VILKKEKRPNLRLQKKEGLRQEKNDSLTKKKKKPACLKNLICPGFAAWENKALGFEGTSHASVAIEKKNLKQDYIPNPVLGLRGLAAPRKTARTEPYPPSTGTLDKALYFLI